MSKACEEVQSQLAELEPGALRPDSTLADSELAAHLETCVDCRAVWAALEEVDRGLAAMPPVVVPEDLVARTLSAVAAEEAVPIEVSLPDAPEAAAHGAASTTATPGVALPDAPKPSAPVVALTEETPVIALPKSLQQRVSILDTLSRYPQAVAAAAALLFLTTILGLGGFWLTASEGGSDAQLAIETMPDGSRLIYSIDEEAYNGMGWSGDEPIVTAGPGHSGGGGDRWDQSEPSAPPPAEPRRREQRLEEREGSRTAMRDPYLEDDSGDADEPDDDDRLFATMDDGRDRASSSDSRRNGDRNNNRPERTATPVPADQYLADDLNGDASGRGEGLAGLAAPSSGPVATGETALPQSTITFDNGRYGYEFPAGEDGYYHLGTEQSENAVGGQDAQDVSRLDLRIDAIEERGPEFYRTPSAGDIGGNITTTPHGTLSGLLGHAPSASDLELARAFLSERGRTSDLTFQPARGYWENTYVPGDPVLRELQRRLEYSDEQDPGQTSGLALARRVDTYSQPFDRPQRSALAVYTQADNRGVTGESRVLVQVGLQGTSRQSGRRPAMNIGVVLDLRFSLSSEVKEGIHALLEELSEARDVGDHFSLTVAGAPGGTVIPPGTFGYGPVTVVANDLLEGPQDRSSGLTVTEALETAIRLVRENDDPSAALGSSLVLLVTPNVLFANNGDLEGMAHLAAVDGIPTSVVGVGGAIDLAELDRIALAGQGNRRLLADASEAEAVVGNELSAASRVVARAVRLRIRLAPGVRLVDVLGSHRLDEATAERVREAEQSIDQRVARSLGITADRGEDEDGIQIVIPAFYANDRHVILLDVVVPGPGPVADVTLRYKDLVFLRNGVAMDTLRLARDDGETGPLEVNVLKNLVAFELSQTLKRAGDLVRAGHVEAGVGEISDFSGLLRGLQGELPQFNTDPEIFADLEMIRTYVQVLGGASRGSGTVPTDLADSLLYAGYRKLLAAPPINDR